MVTFTFNFFLHGDSTVCSNVDGQQHANVYMITSEDLQAAQSISGGLRGTNYLFKIPFRLSNFLIFTVILAPYGLQAYLTGHVFKDNDQSVQKFLADWKKIYPLNSKSAKENGSLHISSPFNSLSDDKKLSEDDYLSKVVEIIIGDCKMKYPFCYVFITDVDRKMYQLRKQKTDSESKSFNLQETLAQLNKQSEEALENCQLTVSYNQQQPSDTFCLKSSTNQAIKQCDSLFLDKVNSTREDGSNDFANSMINGDLLLKKSCNCTKCQQSNLKKHLKSGNGSNGLPSSAFNQFSSKSKDRSFEKERGKNMKNCMPFHKRAELSLKPDEEFIISSTSSLMQSQTSASSPVNSNVNMSSSSLNQSSATPIIMSYKSPVSTSTSSILNTPGIESSPLSNFNCDAGEHTSPITSKDESASINTPTNITSQLNQSPKDKSGLNSTLSPNGNQNSLSNTAENLNGKSQPSAMPNADSGVKSEASMATSQLCSSVENPGEKGPFPMKRPFLFKNVYEGDHDLRHGLLYDFSCESESDQSWQLPLPKNRRINDNSLMNDFMLDLNCRRDYADYSIHELPHFRNNNLYEFKEIEGMGVAASKQHFDPSIESMVVTERSLNEMINGTSEQQSLSGNSNNNGKLVKSKESNDLSNYNKASTNAKSAFSRNDDDFANTFSDLEYLNSSGDESNDNFQAPLTPKNSNGPSTVPHIPDSDSYVSNSINELSRMFPTPPSLEAMQASPGTINNSHTVSTDSKNDKTSNEGAQEPTDKREQIASLVEEVKVSFNFNFILIFIHFIFLGLFFCVQASDAIVFRYLKKLRSVGECGLQTKFTISLLLQTQYQQKATTADSKAIWIGIVTKPVSTHSLSNGGQIKVHSRSQRLKRIP